MFFFCFCVGKIQLNGQRSLLRSCSLVPRTGREAKEKVCPLKTPRRGAHDHPHVFLSVCWRHQLKKPKKSELLVLWGLMLQKPLGSFYETFFSIKEPKIELFLLTWKVLQLLTFVSGNVAAQIFLCRLGLKENKPFLWSLKSRGGLVVGCAVVG